MSFVVRRLGLWGLCTGLLLCGCDSEGSDGMGDSQGSDGTSTGTADTMPPTSAETTAAAEDTSSGGGGDVTSSDPGTTTISSADESSSGAEEESSGSETGGAVVFDEEFVWVADFLRANCVACHLDGTNGNLLLPSAEISNDEVRFALEDVTATTGLLLVEPFDRNASQTYLQITNEFGAQFPDEETDRFGAWIDAGAQYTAR